MTSHFAKAESNWNQTRQPSTAAGAVARMATRPATYQEASNTLVCADIVAEEKRGAMHVQVIIAEHRIAASAEPVRDRTTARAAPTS
jgi:hypothetical protein